MRYHVRNARGEELVVPTLDALHDLYVHGFLGEDDLVRAATASRWVRAGAFPPLHGVREKRADPRKVTLLLGVAVAIVLALALLVGR
jgi:hypothetical protein